MGAVVLGRSSGHGVGAAQQRCRCLSSSRTSVTKVPQSHILCNAAMVRPGQRPLWVLLPIDPSSFCVASSYRIKTLITYMSPLTLQTHNTDVYVFVDVSLSSQFFTVRCDSSVMLCRCVGYLVLA